MLLPLRARTKDNEKNETDEAERIETESCREAVNVKFCLPEESGKGRKARSRGLYDGFGTSESWNSGDSRKSRIRSAVGRVGRSVDVVGLNVSGGEQKIKIQQ